MTTFLLHITLPPTQAGTQESAAFTDYLELFSGGGAYDGTGHTGALMQPRQCQLSGRQPILLCKLYVCTHCSLGRRLVVSGHVPCTTEDPRLKTPQ